MDQNQPPPQGPPPPVGQPAGQPPFPMHPHHRLQQQQQQLQVFWAHQRREAELAGPTELRAHHQLPLARIKKIMKADEDVRMISAEAPVLFAKACELFILELTIRSWLHAEENKRRTLQRNDVAASISRTDVFDFLVDIVPREEVREEPGGLGFLPGGTAGGVPVPAGTAAAAPGVPYYYPPAMIGQPANVPGMTYMPHQMPVPGWQASTWQQGGAGEDGGYNESYDGSAPPPAAPPG
ncbi:hypothetical protein LUZ60_015198 [Juncus effusus]|nr:hypothetical protein LUZ60_015198 [Juncus effusus]